VPRMRTTADHLIEAFDRLSATLDPIR